MSEEKTMQCNGVKKTGLKAKFSCNRKIIKYHKFWTRAKSNILEDAVPLLRDRKWSRCELFGDWPCTGKILGLKDRFLEEKCNQKNK